MYTAHLLKMAAAARKMVWETESTFPVHWCLISYIQNVQTDNQNNGIVQYWMTMVGKQVVSINLVDPSHFFGDHSIIAAASL